MSNSKVNKTKLGIRDTLIVSLSLTSITPIFKRMTEEQQRHELKVQMLENKVHLYDVFKKQQVEDIVNGYRQQINKNLPLFLRRIKKFGRRYQKEGNQNG